MADGTFHASSDVQAKFRALGISANAIFTQEKIDEEISRTENYVMGRIEPYYDISVITVSASPVAYSIIKEICVLYTAGKVNEILRQNSADRNSEAESEKYRTDKLIGRAEKMLKGIGLFVTVGNVDGSLSLYDATAKTLNTSAAATGQGTATPVFKKDTEQW